ncbi:PREDICTED: uncharacterized protein LOC109189145 isoform X2 [Ipomoea nil]|uniref:uncharacterized protein LOC109189145 isoform X2 n=1 Tax=Ipomoea nil TaxID=35883 RepID=UPI000901C327|nr:PREDICTED: uncharacterized protein LOC109189145 isoform X2 [Ipomoea nil]
MMLLINNAKRGKMDCEGLRLLINGLLMALAWTTKVCRGFCQMRFPICVICKLKHLCSLKIEFEYCWDLISTRKLLQHLANDIHLGCVRRIGLECNEDERFKRLQWMK